MRTYPDDARDFGILCLKTVVEFLKQRKPNLINEFILDFLEDNNRIIAHVRSPLDIIILGSIRGTG